MKILGITGGIGAGKSTVTQIFEKLGATVIDADKISRETLEPGGIAVKAVADAFGRETLRVDGGIDRKKVSEIVFGNQERLNLLNQIIHPLVFFEMERQIKEAKTELVCLDVPLLFTCGFPIKCDKTLAVLAPIELRIKRVIKRDNSTIEQVKARIEKQLTDAEFRERADYCIENDGEEALLNDEVKKIYREMVGDS